MKRDNWSDNTPIQIPARPKGIKDTRAYVTMERIKVTEINEATSVYLTSPAPLRHPPKIISEIWKSTMTIMNLEMSTPSFKMSSCVKNKPNSSLPKKNKMTARMSEIINPIN